MRISIITVCFNAEKTIEKTILSILNQENPVYEYIIIDGKSSDSTVEIVKSYKNCFETKGIKFKWVSEKDSGISDAFNKGILLATGDLIGLINADDELISRTSSQLQTVLDNIDADIIYGDCIWTNEDGSSVLKKPKHDMSLLLYNMVLYHPAVFVKKDVYLECGLFDISYRYCMDKHFLYRCYLAGKKFHYLDEPLTIFKAGGISDTHYRSVYHEGSKMAIEFGEPKIKVLLIEMLKNIKHAGVVYLKSIGLYKFIKKYR